MTVHTEGVKFGVSQSSSLNYGFGYRTRTYKGCHIIFLMQQKQFYNYNEYLNMHKVMRGNAYVNRPMARNSPTARATPLPRLTRPIVPFGAVGNEHVPTYLLNYSKRLARMHNFICRHLN